MRLASLLCTITVVVAISTCSEAHNCTCNKDVIRHGDWILVFRGEADNGISMYDTWMNDAIYHDSPVLPWLIKPACASIGKSCTKCGYHFKSRIIPLWEQANVQKVKLLLLKDKVVKSEIIFNGRGSTKTSWFSQSRVISSPWRDLKTAPANYFSMHGHWSRHFFMNSEYRGCPDDLAWMFVIDNNINKHTCNWDKPIRFPKIVYTNKSQRTRTGDWLTDFEYGDMMAILVKLGI